MIEILHENFSLLKLRYLDLNSKSPHLNPIHGKDILLCLNDYKAECGYFIEYFIVDDFQELKHLKLRNITLYPLTDYKYWSDFNFNKMKDFNRKEIIKDLFNINPVQYDKRTSDEEEDIRCMFRKFNP